MKKVKKVKRKTMKSTVPQASKKVEKEVKRILTSNKSRLNLEEESNIPFVKSFLYSLLKEQEEEKIDVETSEIEDTQKSPEDFTPERNKEDFAKSLEAETSPDQFDVEGVSPELTVQNVEKIAEWSKKLDDFAMFLNSPEEDSLHKILADNDRAGSLLRGITRKASDSITRIAGEIEKLKEILNTYINTAPKKMRDQESLQLGS